MKVEIVDVVMFKSGHVTFIMGDKVTCTHKYFANENDTCVKKDILCERGINEKIICDRSILFHVNGDLTHIIGNEKTQKWLESLV